MPATRAPSRCPVESRNTMKSPGSRSTFAFIALLAACGTPTEQTKGPPPLLDAGRTSFDAEVRTLDFAAPTALPTINDWVKQKTEGKIPAILDEIARDEVMFLINAIYFKGSWRAAFDSAKTRAAPFHAADG